MHTALTLYLGRHGIAPPAGYDAQRVLSAEGKAGVRRVAHFLADGVLAHSAAPPPAIIYSSPLKRARETAAIYAEYFPQAPQKILQGIAPESNAFAAATALNGCQETALVITHLPFVAYCLDILTSSTAQIRNFPSGFLAHLGKATPEDRHWRLLHFWEPAHLPEPIGSEL